MTDAIQVALTQHRGRVAREGHQQLYAQRVTLPDGRRGTLDATGVIAREVDAPPGSNPSRGGC